MLRGFLILFFFFFFFFFSFFSKEINSLDFSPSHPPSYFLPQKLKGEDERKSKQANTILMHLSEDFVAASRAVGKIIISEVYVPYEQKVPLSFLITYY